MQPEALTAMVDSIYNTGVPLRGVMGDPATAALFAGQWTERQNSAALPVQGQRIYEVVEIRDVPGTPGCLRKPQIRDCELLVRWLRQFRIEIDDPIANLEAVVDKRLAKGRFWFWDDGRPVSLAGVSQEAAGVVRIQIAYSPKEYRGQGYCTACVAALSNMIRRSGRRCILCADLGNATSNTMFRRIGYRAVSEVVRYQFVPVNQAPDFGKTCHDSPLNVPAVPPN
jgi:hypothetical protein